MLPWFHALRCELRWDPGLCRSGEGWAEHWQAFIHCLFFFFSSDFSHNETEFPQAPAAVTFLPWWTIMWNCELEGTLPPFGRLCQCPDAATEKKLGFFPPCFSSGCFALHLLGLVESLHWNYHRVIERMKPGRDVHAKHEPPSVRNTGSRIRSWGGPHSKLQIQNALWFTAIPWHHLFSLLNVSSGN